MQVLSASFTAIILIVLVMLIQKLFAKGMGPRLRHALWILVLIRLLIPVTPELPVGLQDLFSVSHSGDQDSFGETENPAIPNSPLQESTTSTQQVAKNSQEQLPNTLYTENEKGLENQRLVMAGNQGSWLHFSLPRSVLAVLSIVWVTGCILFMTHLLLAGLLFRRTFRSFHRVQDPLLLTIVEDCKTKLGIRRDVLVYQGQGIQSPFLFGFLRPKIYLPSELVGLANESGLAHIILHELAHYRRGDVVHNLCSMLALAIHWFNPMVWLAVNRMKTDREVACDAYVLELLGEEESVSYGMTLLSLSRLFAGTSRLPISHSHFYHSKNQMKRRITMISQFKKGSYKLTAAMLVLLLAISPLALANASPITAEPGASAPAVQAAGSTAAFLEALGKTPHKSLYNLDRAKRLAGFDFKVPDYVPKGYALYNVFLEQGGETADHQDILFFHFWNTPDAGLTSTATGSEQSFGFSASPGNLLKYNRSSTEKNVTTIYKEKPLTLSKVKGTVLTVQRTNKAQHKGGPDTIVTVKHFIWQDGKVWYELEYEVSQRISTGQGGESVIRSLPQKELAHIVQSLTVPDQATHVTYTTAKMFNDAFNIYDEVDYQEAVRRLGFTPQFAAALPEGFAVEDFGLSVTEPGSISASYRLPQAQGKDLTKQVFVSQTKEPTTYELAKKYSQTDMKERPEQLRNLGTQQSINVDGTEVFYFHSNEGSRYLWKEKDLYYKMEFQGDIANRQDMVKAVMAW